MLNNMGKRMEGIFNETPISFPSFDDFYSPTGDSLMTFELRPEVQEQHRWSGLNPGQHLGKPVPKGTQCKHPLP